ncbi:ABC transporter ATP-binding protein [Sulfuriroseicoccus oceanibius]|uniref:ABC transporter ATP-binding protein n=1 Tax=Sulfuriroseicoccus oceanibius TaxID=2707525 RepID=A0A6B3L9F3_9BACT|nr:ABC transporter ATP-binding protein [Sulfuriroseicoccus oceanibius]QQL43854.1 ABC transporter ATP-binding protein [Sulfuriroseicoccus oceanibius]
MGACTAGGVVHDVGVISLSHVTKQFQATRKADACEAVRDVSFDVESGKVTCLLGPNGSGKTTLLRMLAGVMTPTAGEVVVAGHRLPGELAEVQRVVGFVTGSTRLYGKLTGREILRYFGKLHGIERKPLTARIAELIGLLDLGEFIDKRVDTLSMGMRQRVSIARALIHDPRVVVLDEPTAGLDILSSRALMDLMLSLRDQGRTVLCSTHLMGEVSLIADRVVIIHEGTIRFDGELTELYEKAGDRNLEHAFLEVLGIEKKEVQA